MTPSPPSPPASSPAAADAPSAADAEPKRLSLNVRTLDHTTYPISIGSNASVLQLKELVALETGVGFARQRLIFRGRVLKNDQSIAAYALEDGHTLHLVARAADSAETTSAVANTINSTTNARDPAAPAPRNNDEPDPTLGGQGQGGSGAAAPQVVLGLPDGGAVNMPFLTHMIANIMTSAHGGAIPSGRIVISDVDLARGGSVSYADFVRPGSAPVVGVAAAHGSNAATRREDARARRRSDLRAFGGAARTRGGATTAAAAAGGSMTSGLANLRARSEQLLETVRANVENEEYNLAGLEATQLEATNDTDAAFLQAQLTRLDILMETFRARLHLLPIALRELQRRSASPGALPQTQTQPSVSAIVRTIDTLQNVGESVGILARLARYLFIRHNPGFTGGSIRLNEGDAVSVTSGSAGGGTDVTVTAGDSAGAGTSDSARRAVSERRAASHRRRYASSRAAEGSRGSGESARSGNALFSLLERMNESIRGVTAESTDANSGTATSSDLLPSLAEQQPPPSSSSSLSSSSSVATPVGQLPQFSMANMGLPLGSMVFPISFTDLNANTTTTTWNLADLVNRVASEVPAATLFNVISGEPVAIHQVMAQIGYALVSGVDVPPVSRATIRTWSHSFTTELRQQLRSRGVPMEVLSHIDASRQSRFVDNLIRPLEAFVPDLVDFFLRATSASRTAAFGSSSIDFLGTMSRQFVRHMRTYVGGDGETLRRVLQSLLEYFGLDSRLASFAIANFLDWVDSRRRELDSSGSTESAPAIKRRREG